MIGLRTLIRSGAYIVYLAAGLTSVGGAAQADTLTTPKTVVPGPPGPAGPSATQPPEIQAKPPSNGVIKPPGDISRMPVIKPKMPSRMPVIPPTGADQGKGGIKVVPK